MKCFLYFVYHVDICKVFVYSFKVKQKHSTWKYHSSLTFVEHSSNCEKVWQELTEVKASTVQKTGKKIFPSENVHFYSFSYHSYSVFIEIKILLDIQERCFL